MAAWANPSVYRRFPCTGQTLRGAGRLEDTVARVKGWWGKAQAGPKPRTRVSCIVKKAAHYDVYIGRANPRNRSPPASPWANPFRGEHAIERFRKYLTAPKQAWLRKRLPELRGKILGCWCHPLACHGDVLAKLADR